MKFTTEGLLYLHNNLVALKAIGPLSLQDGVCRNVSDEDSPAYETQIGHSDTLSAVISEVVWKTTDSWCTGDNFFPVKCPGITDPAEAYYGTYDVWEGEYGANRRKLVDAMIEHVELLISEVQP